MDKLKPIYASAYSAVITVLAVTVMTIYAELSASFKTWLAGFTGHHWVTKSWASILIFILFFGFFWFARKAVNESQTRKALFMLQIASVLGFFVILGFYTYEFFAH